MFIEFEVCFFGMLCYLKLFVIVGVVVVFVVVVVGVFVCQYDVYVVVVWMV